MTRPSGPPRMDAAVAEVEAILDRAAARTQAATASDPASRPFATHALSLCACLTLDESPIWLIYTVGQDGIAWRRLGDRQSPDDVLYVVHATGEHPSPHEVLDWLRTDDPAPGYDMDFPEDVEIHMEIHRRILAST